MADTDSACSTAHSPPFQTLAPVTFWGVSSSAPMGDTWMCWEVNTTQSCLQPPSPMHSWVVGWFSSFSQVPSEPEPRPPFSVPQGSVVGPGVTFHSNARTHTHLPHLNAPGSRMLSGSRYRVLGGRVPLAHGEEKQGRVLYNMGQE